MTYNVNSLMRLRVKAEPHASFAVDMTSSMTSWVDIPVREGSLTMTTEQPTKNPELSYPDMYLSEREIRLQKRGRLSFEVTLHTPDTVAASGITAAQTPVGYLLGIAMDGENIAFGATIDTVYEDWQFDLNEDYNNMEPGAAIGRVYNGILEVREITQYNKSLKGIKQIYSETPSESDVIYACRTYYLDGHVPSDIRSLQAVVEGYDYGSKEDSWVYSGGQIDNPIKVTVKNGEIPSIGCDWIFADWDNGDDKEYRPSVDGMQLATYTQNNDLCVLDSEIRIDEIGSTAALNTYHIDDFRVDLGVMFVPVMGPGGTNGIIHYRMDVTKPPVRCEITLPYEDQSFYDYMKSETSLYIAYQIGRTLASGSIMISIPTAQVVGVNRVDMNGIMGQRVTFIGRDDEDTVLTQDSDNYGLARSPFRIHIF